MNERAREVIDACGWMGLELCLSCNVHADMVCGRVESQFSFLLFSTFYAFSFLPVPIAITNQQNSQTLWRVVEC